MRPSAVFLYTLNLLTNFDTYRLEPHLLVSFGTVSFIFLQLFLNSHVFDSILLLRESKLTAFLQTLDTLLTRLQKKLAPEVDAFTSFSPFLYSAVFLQRLLSIHGNTNNRNRAYNNRHWAYSTRNRAYNNRNRACNNRNRAYNIWNLHGILDFR